MIGVLELVLAVYLVFGSYAAGYIFLRAGWPQIRALEEAYKLGWAIVLGVLYAAACYGLTALLMVYAGMMLLPAMLAAMVVLFASAMALLTLRRKYIGGNRVVMRLPKEFISAEITKTRLKERIEHG